MAATRTFSVSKKGGPSMEGSWSAPESVDDPRWDEVVSNPEEDINELAVQNLIIKIQGGARNRLDQGEEAVQAYIDAYVYGQRTSIATRKPSLSDEQVSDLAFTPEQLAALRAAGMQVPGEAAA